MKPEPMASSMSMHNVVNELSDSFHWRIPSGEDSWNLQASPNASIAIRNTRGETDGVES